MAPPAVAVGGVAAPFPVAGSVSVGRRSRTSPAEADGVAVQAAQNSVSFAVKLIHRSSAMGVPKAPYMLFAATPWR